MTSDFNTDTEALQNAVAEFNAKPYAMKYVLTPYVGQSLTYGELLNGALNRITRNHMECL